MTTAKAGSRATCFLTVKARSNANPPKKLACAILPSQLQKCTGLLLRASIVAVQQ
jgi:hypothetical protein